MIANAKIPYMFLYKDDLYCVEIVKDKVCLTFGDGVFDRMVFSRDELASLNVAFVRAVNELDA